MSEMTSELPVCETMEEEMPISRRKESMKRRSSIFQRRSILLPATSNETQELDETKITTFPTATPTSPTSEEAKVDEADEVVEGPFDLRAYIDGLKQEKQEWQNIRQERRNLYRNLVKKKSTVEENGQEVDLSILTESERDFVEARPNYEHLVESSQDLIEMAVRLSILNKHCTQLCQRFHDKMQQNVKAATKKIISMVD